MNTRDIVLRTAEMHDAEAIALHNQAMAQETENLSLDWGLIFPGVKAVLADPAKGFYLVAEQNGKVVGNLMITFEWSDWRNCNLWWFQSVYLQPGVRGQGLFRRMFEWVRGEAQKQGVKELRLYVEQENLHAQKVYAALGMTHSHYQMWDLKI